MLVSIIIINYNTFDITCNCIESIQQYTKGVPYEIVVVDNASPDDNPDLFLEKFPDVVLVKSKENGGFARGNNIGIDNSKGDIILLLNSDTLLTEDSITTAAQELSHDVQAGMLTVRLVYENGRYQNNVRKFRSIRNEVLDVFRPFLMLLPYKKRATMMLNQYFNGDFSTYCDWVSGAFMMFKKEVLQDLPEKKLDERFFMYGEDQLWCYQIKQAGYKNYYTANATVIHIANASTELSKQFRILKIIIDRELAIMRERKGTGLYYQLFKAVYVTKDMLRMYIKILVYRLLGKKIY